jgi:predicted TIM-barrel fold metal-dependent hydrolase
VVITDAQAHIWDAETPERPWPEGGHARARSASYSAEELIAEMNRAGIAAAVLVPPSFQGDSNETYLRAYRQYPARFRIMGRLNLADPANRGRMAQWREQPGMLGVRLTFSRGEQAQWLDDGTADWVWAEAEASGVPAMVFAPDLLDRVGEIARKHPGLKLVLDHLGMRTTVRDRDIDPVLDDLVQLARYDNVAVKASGLPSNVTDDYPHRSLQNRIRRVVEAFGPNRVFWGSDITRLRGSYAQVRDLFLRELPFLTEDDLGWIMGGGLREWIGWSEPIEG